MVAVAPDGRVGQIRRLKACPERSRKADALIRTRVKGAGYLEQCGIYLLGWTLASQQHYISKFHLNQFLDTDSLSTKDPWLWQGFVRDGTVKRRSPKNVGTASLMFDGPGCLADRDATLESFLANEVEGPAAAALRNLVCQPPGSIDKLPPALTRYLAWAAARSLPMQALENSWGENGLALNSEPVEPPPEGLLKATKLQRDVQMLHFKLGSRLFPVDSDLEQAAREGWFPDMHDRTNFLESVHIQAYYFQVRFFPRLKWFALHGPEGEFFVVADRPVGWVADGYIDAPPSSLRHPSAYVLAPICRTLLLVARHTSDPWLVTPAQINAVVASWAHEWIAGPTEATVRSALENRRVALASAGLVQ